MRKLFHIQKIGTLLPKPKPLISISLRSKGLSPLFNIDRATFWVDNGFVFGVYPRQWDKTYYLGFVIMIVRRKEPDPIFFNMAKINEWPEGWKLILKYCHSPFEKGKWTFKYSRNRR